MRPFAARVLTALVFGLGATVIMVAVRWGALACQAFVQRHSPGCMFRYFTGCHCPGCGGTRAVFHLLHGEWGAAWRMNPLFVGLLAATSVFGALYGCAWLAAGRRQMAILRPIPARAGWLMLASVVAFWLLRNLPWWPFTLLAPH